MSEGDDFLDESQDAPADPPYEVGYGKPPLQTRFKPGQSGYKGRRKRKVAETREQIIKRVRDETVRIGKKTMTKFELAVITTLNSTIKSGKPRDLKALLELFDKYGARPDAEEAGEFSIEAMKRSLRFVFGNQDELTPEEKKALDEAEIYDVELVMSCDKCAPALKAKWADTPHHHRHGGTRFENQVSDVKRDAQIREWKRTHPVY